MESCAQYRVLLELALVDVDQFPNGFFGRFVVGMEQLQHVGILPNDFAVVAAPLSRGACGSQALRKAGVAVLSRNLAQSSVETTPSGLAVPK